MFLKRRPTALKYNKRIPELDAARGICIIGMILIHLVYDLTELYPVLTLNHPALFLFFKNQGGIAFFLISGISTTLGCHAAHRGITVFGCALLVSAVTALTGAMPIRFGVLHCLGLCMVLWNLFHPISNVSLCILGIIFAGLGLIFRQYTVSVGWLFPLGLTTAGFVSADYFPLFPFLGYFLLGAASGRKLYPRRQTRFPRLSTQNLFLRFLCFCGRHSLWIYLLHQPVILLFLGLIRR